jgi:hypothetical protein
MNRSLAYFCYFLPGYWPVLRMMTITYLDRKAL